MGPSCQRAPLRHGTRASVPGHLLLVVPGHAARVSAAPAVASGSLIDFFAVTSLASFWQKLSTWQQSEAIPVRKHAAAQPGGLCGVILGRGLAGDCRSGSQQRGGGRQRGRFSNRLENWSGLPPRRNCAGRQTRVGNFTRKLPLGMANQPFYFNLPRFWPIFSVSAAGGIGATDAGCCTGELPDKARGLVGRSIRSRWCCVSQRGAMSHRRVQGLTPP